MKIGFDPPPNPALVLPAAKLAEYLQATVPGFHGPLVAEKFAGGQSNPTYTSDAARGR